MEKVRAIGMAGIVVIVLAAALLADLWYTEQPTFPTLFDRVSVDFENVPADASPTNTKLLVPIKQQDEAQITQQTTQLEQKLAQEERVRVVLQLDESTDRKEFVERYNLDKETAKTFDIFPFIAVEIDQDDLARLKEGGELRAIQEDILLRPVLSQSVPLIGADTVTNSYGYNGSGVAVVVLDTGVNKSHSAFQSRVVDEACYSTHNPGSNVYSLCPGSLEEVNGSDTGLDCDESTSGCGHGTHVAGIIAANHASGDGVAPGANIIAIKVFSQFTSSGTCSPSAAPCALSYFSDITLGLERAYELRNTYDIAAVSISIGGGEYSANCDGSFASLKGAIDNLRAAGIATVIASGNDGYTSAMGAPACISSAISVGATTKADAVAAYSNSASFLSILAPGSSIYAPVISGGYGYKSGTSMATPHVSGTFALLHDAFPTKTVDELLAALQNTGTNLTKSSITKPRINVDLAYLDLLDVTYTDFDGNTTDFSNQTNLSNVCNPILERSGQGRISFGGCVNASGADLDSFIQIENRTISVNSSALPSWNQSATLTFYDVNLIEPIIIDDDTQQECDHCSLVANDGNNVTITVSHFSSYTINENITLTLTDDTDSVSRATGEDVLFQANLSYVNNTPISDGTCQVTYETASGDINAGLTYNATSLFYEHPQAFSAGGTYDWNVTCTHATNPTIQGTDTYTIIEYGTLRAIYESHAYAAIHQVNPDATFVSAGAVYCDGNGTAICGNITSFHLDNRTGSFTATDTNSATTPLYSASSQPQQCTGLTSDAPCYLNFTINASGSAGESFQTQLNYSSNLAQVTSITGTTATITITSFDENNLTQVANTTSTTGATGSFSQTTNGIQSEAGNLTLITLDGDQSTLKWQGIYGNVSTGLRLGDGSDVFYDFGQFSPYAIIATQSTGFNFENVSAGTPADVDTQFGFTTPSDIDQAVDTFTKVKLFGSILDVPYATLNERFFSGVVQDQTPSSKDDLGFIGVVNITGAQGFRNQTYNYQLLVPVQSGVESYYLYLAFE